MAIRIPCITCSRYGAPVLVQCSECGQSPVPRSARVAR